MKNTLDKKYLKLLSKIMKRGIAKNDRTGTGTLSTFGGELKISMKEGFPILTTKKINWENVVTELVWFLRGETHINFLLENNCNIWNGDAYKRYSKGTYDSNILNKKQFINKIKEDYEFSSKWGDLGPIYGKQWRDWTTLRYETGVEPLDQIKNLIYDIKTDPDSRRLMVAAWNPSQVDKMVLPPCHYGFQIYTRELTFEERCVHAINEGWMSPLGALDFPETRYALDKSNTPSREISLKWNQRSVDTFLGLPFNISSYGLLLHLLAEEVNMIPGNLIGSFGDLHLYNNHLDSVRIQLSRDSFPLPKLNLKTSLFSILNRGTFDVKDFELEDYVHGDFIKGELSN